MASEIHQCSADKVLLELLGCLQTVVGANLCSLRCWEGSQRICLILLKSLNGRNGAVSFFKMDALFVRAGW
ncbi:hypothetical protein CER18_08795 [Bartonella tribocorum]|uniref:Uncharacterized protein n=1 Tax=Bartonella tribocorum TaxID=85701 RepID=A0A2N9Y8D5_9HYPH|nr:hypothetical protein CER18_08795 [Bartonella tribocorum]